ncbi:hypothetical protein [Marinomonas algarum]|uniref:Porin n=1 Tax=Marinomonas algarum TaxID=2883105 RepID=A0A9X1INA7_9GAMM|nr:hypothetical protein [Marinomonas algarum]MCB5162360.1 hypothetical protein [Marinomonas algarum]
MLIKNKVALAVLAAGLSTQAFALDLGEYNGTNVSIGGYLKAEAVMSNPDDGENVIKGSASQSRVNLTTTRTEGEHKIKGLVEGDFRGAGDEFRLRHAAITVDNVTVGQTWNAQFLATAPLDTPMINFYGPGFGTIGGNGAVVRPDLVVHYAKDGLRLSLQDPVYTEASVPDLVAAYTMKTEAGHAFNVAVTGREVGTTGNESEFGAALSLAAKLKFGDTSLTLSGFSGEGVAVYAGWGYSGAAGANSLADVDTSTNDLITTTGFSAGITQQLSEKLKVNLRYGQVSTDESSLADDTMKLTTVNAMYAYLPSVDLGIEWRDQNAKSTGGANNQISYRPAGQQVEVMAMYKF